MKDYEKFIDKITVKNFKGFSHVELKELSNLNLFIGHNNIGKTSILEALAFAAGIEPRDFFTSFINETRHIAVDKIKDYQKFFYQFQIKNPVSVDCHYKNIGTTAQKSRHTLTYKIEYQTMPKEENDKIKVTACKNENDSISWQFSVKEEPSKDGTDPLQNLIEGAIRKALQETRIEWLNNTDRNGLKKYEQFFQKYQPVVCFVQNNFLLSPQEITLMEGRNNQKQVLEFIQEIDNRVDVVQVSANTLNIYYKGMDAPFPLSVMGSGFIKILKLYLAILCNGTNIILFDEISDGLSPETIGILLKYIIPELCNRNIQLFATTHSYDILQQIADYKNNDKDCIAAYYLYHDNDKIQVHRYSQHSITKLKGFIDLRGE